MISVNILLESRTRADVPSRQLLFLSDLLSSRIVDCLCIVRRHDNVYDRNGVTTMARSKQLLKCLLDLLVENFLAKKYNLLSPLLLLNIEHEHTYTSCSSE
jgi:hypothetical protein